MLGQCKVDGASNDIEALRRRPALHCCDPFGPVVPVLHRAIATGLRHYAADLDGLRPGQCICGSRSCATFVDPTLRAIAIVLSKVSITADGNDTPPHGLWLYCGST